VAGGKKSEAELNDLIEHIVVDAYGDDEQLWAFRQVMEDEIRLPADAFVMGESVTVLEIDYDGNERRGLTARCRREDGSEHRLAASRVPNPEEPAAVKITSAPSRYKPTATVEAFRGSE